MGRAAAKQRKHPRDKCAEEACQACCAPGDVGRLEKYENASESLAMAALSAVLTSPATMDNAAERVELIKLAACQLTPQEANFVREIFEDRRHLAGERFGRLSTASRCAILDVLDQRAIYTDVPLVEPRRKGEISEELTIAVRNWNQAEIERQGREQEQFQLDLEMHRKAGASPGFIGSLFPAHTRHMLRPWAHRIQNPVLRQAATIAEAGRSMSPLNAALDPIARPIAAALELIECFFAKAADAEGNRLVDAYKRAPWAALSFPADFMGGAAVGIAAEAWDTVKGIWEMVTDPGAMIEGFNAFMTIVWSPDALDIACDLGADLGEHFQQYIVDISGQGASTISHEIGRIAGPAVVWTMLAVAAPYVVAPLKGVRILRRLFKWLAVLADKIPFLRKLLKRDKDLPDTDVDAPKQLPMPKDPPEFDFPAELVAPLDPPVPKAFGQIKKRLAMIKGQDQRASLFNRLIERIREIDKEWWAVPANTTDGSYFWRGVGADNSLAVDVKGRVFQSDTADAWTVVDDPSLPPNLPPFLKPVTPNYDKMRMILDE